MNQVSLIAFKKKSNAKTHASAQSFFRLGGRMFLFLSF
ncbi:hypothetical protein SynSYN20_01003 [Synechococcus sp. SYN20]|nr:hypothetical protein SynSYN20_01003 [Synechococcus sp. SYN20]